MKKAHTCGLFQVQLALTELLTQALLVGSWTALSRCFLGSQGYFN
jgi:hypothetical protein